MQKTVVLREERSESGLRYLEASVTENGDLCILGQDLGSGVEAFWGEGRREYEWDIFVSAEHIPKMIVALGGAEGDDILSLLKARCFESDSTSFLESHDIPFKFWSRVGD